MKGVSPFAPEEAAVLPETFGLVYQAQAQHPVADQSESRNQLPSGC